MTYATQLLVLQRPTLKKKRFGKTVKSLVLPGFGQLQSDRSISNLMMSHWSIKGITARADYYWQVDQ